MGITVMSQLKCEECGHRMAKHVPERGCQMCRCKLGKRVPRPPSK